LCTSIDFDLQLGSVVWVDSIPPEAPSEIWSVTTAFYDFQIEVQPDTKYIPVPGAKMEITVRNAGTDSAPEWKLRRVRDIGSGSFASPLAAVASTEESTWGSVKWIFRGPPE
jgi:hypothetical protein